ncbi:hypothetical protein RRG08_030782 [Elysia crispata]|uniref:Uncharacterized protein n=1 Tax=Elysia crispata TaxID=231223 RepID=A0AAE1CYF4_9GAST|nr:hypothetical protein RRG08_030782 [Elysia crispata]
MTGSELEGTSAESPRTHFMPSFWRFRSSYVYPELRLSSDSVTLGNSLQTRPWIISLVTNHGQAISQGRLVSALKSS